MPYDIYGNDLRRGYCEVHPHVQQEYPCDLCYREIQAEDAKRKQQAQYRVVGTSETVRIVIDELIKRIPRASLKEPFIDIDFGGNYMIQISQTPIDTWQVSNAMNGGGYNCFDEFKECTVTILND